MKAIRTRKAFERVMAELAGGDVDAYGASDHRETVAALRKYIRNCVPPSEFAEVSALSARVSEAEETGYHARLSNRARLELELRRAVAQAAYDRVSNHGR